MVTSSRDISPASTTRSATFRCVSSAVFANAAAAYPMNGVNAGDAAVESVAEDAVSGH